MASANVHVDLETLSDNIVTIEKYFSRCYIAESIGVGVHILSDELEKIYW